MFPWVSKFPFLFQNTIAFIHYILPFFTKRQITAFILSQVDGMLYKVDSSLHCSNSFWSSPLSFPHLPPFFQKEGIPFPPEHPSWIAFNFEPLKKHFRNVFITFVFWWTDHCCQSQTLFEPQLQYTSQVTLI